MTTYIALLRAVNVGGNMLKMELTRSLFAKAGFQNVRTYVQSGNVVFQSKSKVRADAIEKLLVGQTRLPVTVILLTAAELRSIADANPFLDEPNVDSSKLHVTFLSAVPSPEGVKRLGQIASGADRIAVLNRQAYLYCPEGYGKTKLSGTVVEKTLGVRSTSRNWNTVTKLLEMAGV